MIPTLKPYPAYKDSGVEWLGQVPVHWEVLRTKTLFQSRKQLNTDGSETNVLSLTLRGVVNNHPDNPEGLVPKDYKTYQIFERDDLVFKLIDLENVRTSRVGLVHERGIMSPAYVRLTLSGIGEVRFYYQQFYDLYQRAVYNQIGEGVRSTIGWSVLANLRILAPPLPEQTAIVRFLDYMERGMGRAMRARQKRIKLLEEYKQALIHQAVTGKNDVRTGQPYSAYKPSGVEWLGQAPEHWEVRRNKFLLREVNERSEDGSEELLTVSQYTGVTRRQERLTGEGDLLTNAASLVGYKRVMPGDLVINIMLAWNGSLGTSSIHGIVSPSYAVFRTKLHGVQPRFLHYLFRTPLFTGVFKTVSTGVVDSRLRLYPDVFLRLPSLLPPLPEQSAIVEYLDAQTAKIDAAIAAACREIELLREYRERLIADVVTGKVDVREVAERLPEEPPEEEAAEWLDEETTTEDAEDEGLSEESDAEA